MFSVEELEELKKKHTGWIDPQGKLLICEEGYMTHIKVLPKFYQDFYEEAYTRIGEEIDEQLAGEEEADPKGFHPAWHRFDQNGDARDETYREAYKNGWIRLGLYAWSEGNNGFTIEGMEEYIKTRKKDLVFIYDMFDIDTLHVDTEDIWGSWGTCSNRKRNEVAMKVLGKPHKRKR